MNPIALLSGQPLFAASKEFRRAKTYGFWCEVCRAAYALYVPEAFSYKQAEACQKIGRAVCTKEHPHHSERIDIPLGQLLALPSLSSVPYL
jgi:hypothetical protein